MANDDSCSHKCQLSTSRTSSWVVAHVAAGTPKSWLIPERLKRYWELISMRLVVASDYANAKKKKCNMDDVQVGIFPKFSLTKFLPEF